MQPFIVSKEIDADKYIPLEETKKRIQSVIKAGIDLDDARWKTWDRIFKAHKEALPK